MLAPPPPVVDVPALVRACESAAADLEHWADVLSEHLPHYALSMAATAAQLRQALAPTTAAPAHRRIAHLLAG